MPSHNVGRRPVWTKCGAEIKILFKVGGCSAQSQTSHSSCHRKEIVSNQALDTALVLEDNVLKQPFPPVEGINY